MKHRLLFTGALLVAASAAHAAFTITLDNATQTIALPSVATDVIFTGTIHKDEQGTGSASTLVEFAGLPGDIDFLIGNFNSSAYFAWTTTTDANFTGEIFRVTVLPTSMLGLHNSNNGGTSDIEASYTGVTGAQYDSGLIPYGVNIVATPEPTTWAALALGAVALRRRKKK